MKAVRFDKGDVKITDVPVPERRVGEALIRVGYAGICATDLEILKGYLAFDGIPGHEFVGVVEQCDDPFLDGKRVVGEINCACGECPMCHRGNPRHCQRRSVLGITMRDGAFAEYLTLPEENLHIVPDSVPDKIAVLTEPLAAAFRVPEQVHLQPGQKVLVLGDGTMGLLVSMVLHMLNTSVLLIGHHPEKLAIADAAGITTEGDYPDLEFQADLVVDCTGSRTGLERAVSFVRPEGKIVLKTTISDKYSIDLAGVVVKELTLLGSRCGPFPPALDVLAKQKLDLEPIISGVFPLEQAAEAIAHTKQPTTVKVLLKIL